MPGKVQGGSPHSNTGSGAAQQPQHPEHPLRWGDAPAGLLHQDSTKKHVPIPANPCKSVTELHRDWYSCMYLSMLLIYLGIFHINSNNTLTIHGLIWEDCPYPSKLSLLLVNFLLRQTCT